MSIDLTLARKHLKADAEDIEDSLITQYIASATSICENYCNRKFYDDLETLAEARIQARTDMASAIEARDTALDDTDSCEMQKMIMDEFVSVSAGISQRANGIVIDGNITAAILLTLGRLYFVREDSTEVPVAAMRILQPYLWIGDLG